MHPKEHTDGDVRWDKLQEYKEEGYYIVKSRIVEESCKDGGGIVEFHLRLERDEDDE